jgi:hypothetical protein
MEINVEICDNSLLIQLYFLARCAATSCAANILGENKHVQAHQGPNRWRKNNRQ